MADRPMVVISQVKASLSEEVSTFLIKRGLAADVIKFIKSEYDVKSTMPEDDDGVMVLEGKADSVSEAERYIRSVLNKHVPGDELAPRSSSYPQRRTNQKSPPSKQASFGSHPELTSCGMPKMSLLLSSDTKLTAELSAPFTPIPDSEAVDAKDEAHYCKQTRMLEYIWWYQEKKQWKAVQDILKKYDAEITHEKKKNDVWVTVKGLQKENVDAACNEIYDIFMAITLGKVTLAVGKDKKFRSSDVKAVVEDTGKVFPAVLILQRGRTIDAVGSEAEAKKAIDHVVGQLKQITAKMDEKWLVAPEKTTYTLKPKHGPKVYVYKENIAVIGVQVVVCPTNASLASSPGVAGALLKAGGQQYQEELAECKKRGALSAGKIYVTGAGNLPCEKVYQVNGPKGNQTEGVTRDLAACFSACLLTANQAGVRSIAIPAVSAGSNGIPQEIVAASLTEEIISFINSHGRTTPLQEIHFVDRNQAMVDCVATLLEKEVQTCTVNLKKDKTTKPKEKEDQFDILVSGFSKPGPARESPRGSGAHTLPLPRLSAQTGHRLKTKVKTKSHSDLGRDLLEKLRLGTENHPMKSHSKDDSVKTNPASHTIHMPINPSQSPKKQSSSPRENKEKLQLSTSVAQQVSNATEEVCPICQCEPTNPKTLEKCKHTFCTDCIEQCFKSHKAKCPVCGVVYGTVTGNQPADGTMKHSVNKALHLEGYEQHGTIVIEYNFPNGTQTEEHPSPGQPYTGTRRVAYLPDSEQGRKLVGLMKQVFDARLMFTIGRSVTTGRDNVVTWNDIHHKTRPTGGPTSYGYPDPTYLDRLAAELASHGFK